MPEAIKILFLAAEADPFVKVGGLADVAGTLPRVLRDSGLDVRLVLPLHKRIDRGRFKLEKITELSVPSRHGPVPAEVYLTVYDGLPVYLVDSALIAAESDVYDPDSAVDGPKYVHFSLAALALARALDWQPDVLHAQDWHTAAAVYALVRDRRTDPFYHGTAALLTVHNLPYQGEGAAAALEEFGIAPAVGSPLPWWAQNRVLALGLLAADHINTVSPGYAGEMLTEEFGAGLDGFLRDHKAGRVSGILNGLDIEAWDPETDPDILRNYNVQNLAGKARNKAALQDEAGLKVSARIPVFGIVSRMDVQKGIDIAVEALHLARDLDWQAVLLGSGDAKIEAAARSLAEQNRDRVRTWIDFNAALGHRIYAGVDAFLIPSRYEPCGLTQMISMRYGTVPVARAVGGLKDTIEDYDGAGNGTGFLFDRPSPIDASLAIRRTIEAYADQRRWKGLQRRGMKADFSWSASAQSYIQLYKKLIAEQHNQARIGKAGPDNTGAP